MPHPHDDLDLAKTLQGGVQPTLLGRYRVVRELGHGGMGSVYLAEDTHLDGRRVAIKMPSALLARNKRAVADLKREATTAMQLSHPAIVTLRSFEQPPPPEGGVFLVMDYVEGQTLEDLLADKGTLPPEDVVALLKPVAEALDYAHERRVIHRDLKPANILIDQDGRAHLTDFGIAREMKDTMTRVTGRQDTSGTLPYMSPEQVNGENPTPAQDLYSFGAMLYECLAGHPPFHRGQIEHQILNKPADAGALPAGPLARQVMACLAKDANDRPGQAAALFAPSADCKSTTSRASGGREGADPHARQEPAQGPLPDGRGSSEAFQQFAEVFDDMFGKPPQGKLSPGEKPWSRPPQAHTAPPAPRAAASPSAPDATHAAVKSDTAPEQESGCLAGLVVILVSVAFGTAAVFAAKQAPGWAGIGLATLVGLPYGIALHLCYGRTSKHAQAQGKKDTALGDIAFCLVAAALTGAITVHFDSIKAWGTSLIEKEPAALSPTREVTTEVADTPSPHADHPDEPIMVGATYAADLGDGVELVLTYIPSTEEIPAIRGRGFYMGSPESEEGRLDSETQHRVILSDYFLIGTTEVTQGQWMAVMGRNPSLYIGDLNRPVESVSWFDAVQFCEQLTARERIAGRLSDEWVYTLPTEAQWEWACRSESTSRYHSGNSDKNLYEVGWCNGSIDSETSPVGEMRVNAWGLYDMHGNVSEWCSDWYGDYPQGDVADPIGPAQGRSRVVRGGGYLDFPRYCRAACRLSQDPDAAHSGTGFRVVLKRLDDE